MTLSDERHNMLLVVAVLLITITYQVVLSPLGDFGKMMITRTTIALEGSPFLLFLIVNTLTFVFSNSILLVLVPAGHNRTPFFVLKIYLWCCYFCSFLTIIQAPDWTLFLLFLRA
ncbi:hypothetical protein CFP56_041457 [Quercus suber]|uniref:PGG domain-containing protein n=1 Tax=Quercus suber TaxID=58331 RepID=A0AAW0LKZ3_QUESU